MADSGTSGASSKPDKVRTGQFDEGLCEGIHPTDAQKQPSSGKNSDDTLKDSSTRVKELEKISEVPTVQSCIVRGDGDWLVTILGGKTYALPLEFTTKPKVQCFNGFECICHQEVLYKLRQSCMGSLYLQDMNTQEFIKMYEYGTGEGNSESTKSRHGSSNEGTTEEKHHDETLDKSETGAGISTGGNTFRKFEAQTGVTPDLKFCKAQMGDLKQRLEKEYSGGRTNKISGGHTDRTDEKDNSQTNKEEPNQSHGRAMSSQPLGETEKTPKTATSVQDSHQMYGRKTDQKLCGKKDGDSDKISGGKSAHTFDGYAGQISVVENVSETTEIKTEYIHSLASDPKLDNNSDDKIKMCLNVVQTFEKKDHATRNGKGQRHRRGMHEQKKADMSPSKGGDESEIAEQKLSQEASHETYEKKTVQQLGEKKFGGEINRAVSVKTENACDKELSDVHSGQIGKRIAVSTNIEHMDSTPGAQKSPAELNDEPDFDMTHKSCQEHTQKVDNEGNAEIKVLEGTSMHTVAKSTDEIFQQKMNHTPEGPGETSKDSLGQICEVKNHHKSLDNAEKEAEIGSSDDDRQTYDDGDSGSKGTLAVEDQSVQGRESTSQGRTGQEGSDRIQENVNTMTSTSAASAMTSQSTTAATTTGATTMIPESTTSKGTTTTTSTTSESSTNSVPTTSSSLTTSTSQRTILTSSTSMLQTTSTSATSTASSTTEGGTALSTQETPTTTADTSTTDAPSEMESYTVPPRRRRTSSSISAAQKAKQDWRYDDGNGYSLKLLIEYKKKKKKGNDTEDDFCKHEIPCNRTFFLKLNFYTETDCGKKNLDAILAKHNCQVSLSSNDHVRKVFKVSEKQFQDEADVKDFADGVLDNIYICAQESLSIDFIGVDPRIKEDIQDKIKGRKELDCAWIKFVGEDSPINAYTVCHKEHQQSVWQIITEVITDATKAFSNHNEMVAADLMWQKVMTRFGYLEGIGSKFPQTEIKLDEELNAFQLMGPRDETKSAVRHLEELQETARIEVHEEVFSPGYQFEIFTYPEMHDYIDSYVPKLAVVWIPNIRTKEIHLFSKKPEQLKGIDKIIRGCVHEKLYSLSKDYLRPEKDQLIKELKKNLKKKHKGKFVIHLSESTAGLLVTTADDIFKSVDSAVQKIVITEIGEVDPEALVAEKPDARPGQPGCKPQLSAMNADMEMTCFPLETVLVSDKIISKRIEVKTTTLFRKLFKDDMVKFNQMAKEHHVSLHTFESQGGGVGFELKGSEKEVWHIFECINGKIQAEEQQIPLQQDNSGMAGTTEKVDKKMTPSPKSAGKSGSSRMSGKNDKPGLQHVVWTYPSGKKVILVKGTTSDAIVIIPESDDLVGTSGTFMKDNGRRLMVPLWKEGTDHEKEKLREEIKRILIKVSSENVLSVGININPIRCWGFKNYLKCYLYQIDQFHSGKAGTCLVECLMLFTEDGDFYKTASDIMQEYFKEKASMFSTKPQELENVVTSSKDEKEPLFKKIKVSIEKGELHNAKAEVLVNTISQDLDLSRGVISASLLKKAGQGLQREIKNQRRPPVPYGFVIKTGVGSLPSPCKAVLHGVLQHYHHSDDSTSTFSKFLLSCLDQASEYQSIAFPAIGTGKLGYPKDLVACLMLTAVLKFQDSVSNTFLKEVKFVIYPDDEETYQSFKNQLHCLQFGPGKQTAAEEPEMMVADQSVSKTLEYGEVKVKAKHGAMENEANDCLMVFYDKGFLLAEKKVLMLAGNSVTQKWNDHRSSGKFNNGLILVTDGGSLKYTKIIHVACDINTINKAAIKGLQKAESEKMRTIVVPFNQKDPLMRDMNKYCTEILRAVKELATSLVHVKFVMFVVQGLSNFPNFKEIFEKENKGDGIGKKLESNKANDPRLNPGKSVKSATSPSEPEEQQIPRDEQGVDPENVQHSVKGPEVSLARHKIQFFQTSKEKCCIIVFGDIKSREDLKKRFSSYNHNFNKLKHVVYPYKNKSALVIFEKEVDIKTLELGTDALKVQPLQPQLLQELEFLLPDSLVERAQRKGQRETLFTNLTETCGVHINFKDDQVYLVGVTAHQMDIARQCLEEFCEERLNIKINKSSKSLSSSTVDEELYSIVDTLNKVSEVEFKALEIIENGFERIKYAQLSWDGDAILIDGPPLYADYVKKELNSRLGALRNKQCEEISLDKDEKEVVEHVREEMQSKDTICILDEKKSLVVVYSDKQEDIMKFKHKLKIRTGKVKESGRNRKRFAENTTSLEASRGEFSLSVRSTEIREEFSWSKNASDVEIFCTIENIKVAVYMANILNIPVDCIVNAANDNLQHGGGVAKVIADAAGPELVQNGDAIIEEMGRIPVGSQVITVPGRLPYKCVIHTVGPCWLDYKPHNLQKVKDCEEDLYRAIYGCFLQAEKNGLSTVALPAVSSGIYAVPQDMCAVQYARAVLDYSRKSVPGKSLTEIHFIDKIPRLVKLMQDTFRTMIKYGKVPNYDIQNYVTSSSSYQRQQSKEAGWKGHGRQDIAANNNQYVTNKPEEFSPVYYESEEHHKKHFVFQVCEKPVVHIYEGNILKLKNMHAVVCPDDKRGTGMGFIASKLSKWPNYKKLKEKSFKGKKYDLGDVVITYGEDSLFSVIVHVVMENDSFQKPEIKSTMKKCIDNILRKTNEWVHVKTIALPLFGVKYGVLTEKSWAELFLDRFFAFCHEVQNPNLEQVHIVYFSSSSAYSTLMKVFCDSADKVVKAQQQKFTPARPPPPKVCRMSTDDTQDPMSNRGNGSVDDKGEEDDNCTVCMCPKTDPKSLSCGHSFCSDCIDQMFKHKPVCPICGKIVGTLTGDQPKNGQMHVRTSLLDLAGYERHGSIVITYDFPSGKQGPNHPSPEAWYGSMTRTAYLPNTPEGRNVCRMLQLAFERRLVFTISTSRTTGQEGLTWNDIHHKTNPKPGGQFGYPDPEYLSRVKDELAAKGITEADLQPERD